MSFMRETITIQKPIEKVFAKATDFSKSPEIMDTVVDVELLTEGQVREVYKFKETRQIGGRKASTIIEIISYQPNESYSVRSVHNGLDLGYHYTFVETTDGTRVNFTAEMYTYGLRNTLMKPIIQMIIKKENHDHLEHLKKFIETSV